MNLKYLLIFSLFFIFEVSQASHIMGGEITYKYLDTKGPTGTPFRYRINIHVYTNCEFNSCCQTGIKNLTYFIYNLDNRNTDFRNINSKITNVTPPNISNCVGALQPCILSEEFIDTLSLPVSRAGFEIYYSDFARNASILNLNFPNNTGILFHTVIPASIEKNSSPQFTDVAVPFMCLGDTNILVNSATDPDGDQLIFSLAQPYDSYFNPPSNFTSIQYNSGYSNLNPFGANGYAYVDASTGITKLKSNTVGNFVVVIEIKEYQKNGTVSKLMTSTRRELQILVAKCINSAPVITNTVSTFNIVAGDSINFDIEATDIDKDSVTLTATGPIINGNGGYSGPYAHFNTAKMYQNLKSNFSWQTVCENIGQYSIIAMAKDNSCAQQSDIKTFIINVADPKNQTILQYKKQDAPDTIQICLPNNKDTLHALNKPKGVYNWYFNNTSLNNNTKDQIINKTGKYKLDIKLSNCKISDSTWVNATEITDKPHNDSTICFGGIAHLWFDTLQNATYNWYSENGTKLNNFTKLDTALTKTSKFIGNVKLKTCELKDTIYINVNKKLTPKIELIDKSDGIPQTIRIENIGSTGINSDWNFGNQNTMVGNDSIVDITYQNEGYYLVTLKVKDNLGCEGTDTLTIPVTKFLIPNIITPGKEDGLNDDFKIATFGDFWSVEIYNRWGRLVYENKKYHRGWNADEVEGGIYFYHIYDNLFKKEYKGWLQVEK